jgi:hypothetical protein
MRYSISHLGVPVGEVELTPTETAIGELMPVAGYESIRGVIRSASEVLWQNGFLGTTGGDQRFDPAALSRAQNLSLELRDDRGAFIPVDFINIVERPSAGDPPVVFVRFRLAHGHVASIPKQGDRQGGFPER